ncbi:PH domain-containing protein [Fructobacillus sp. M2-14]|uniref:PH domain-containing protein n=1 Tax=Fructobacillus broussonetiae TaxID=2713173 RepID=A0ABS5R0G7_9LACO|nr:PH domain-containing protein [Fructobacillus broussonetiae]MBS9338116.1 PH domain-containing protein [Fructobacillus broussonetiae]
MLSLPKKVKGVWYLSELVSGIVIFAILFGLTWALPIFTSWTLPSWLLSALYVPAAIMVVFGFSMVHYRYAVYHYQVNPTDVEIMRGFFYRRLTAIPIDRVQNVDLDQGPFLQIFKLQKVVLVTGGGHHSIEALTEEDAIAFKDQVMTLAKEARHEA